MSDTITGAESHQPDDAALAAEEDRLWAEADAADAAASDARNPDAGAGDDDQDGDQNSSGSEDDGGQSPHATDSDADKAQPGQGADGQAGAGGQVTDPWAKAPAEYRKLYEEEVTELRRRLAGQDRKIGQLNARLLSPAPVKGKDDKAGTGTEAARLADDPDWKKVEEDFPEIARPFMRELERRDASVQTLQQQLGAMQAGERETVLLDNEQAVLDRHSDFVQVASSPVFREWADGLSPALKSILSQNAQRIVDPQGAIAIVDLFKAQHADSAGAGPGAAPANSQGTGSNLSGRRTRQLEAAASAPHGGGPRVSSQAPGEPQTFDEAWDLAEREDAAKKRRRA